jgi:hypothetical protein
MTIGRGEDQQTVIRLHDGDVLTLSPAEVDRLYDELWLLARRMSGAVTAAAKLKHVATWELLHGEDPLTEDETAAFREAAERASLDADD